MEGSNILETINKSAIKLLAAQSLEPLCITIVEEGKKLVSAEHGSLYLLVNNKLERVYTSSPVLKKAKIKKRGVTERTFQTRTIHMLHSKEINNAYPVLKELGIQSVVMIPLSYKNEAIGVLMMHSLKDEYFISSQLHVLKLYGSMVSLALVKTRLHDETKQALELRDRFIALASHELRTPLTSLNGYIQLLYNKLAKKDTVESRWVKELSTESARLTMLVKELLDINRIKQGQLAFTLREVNMQEIIEKVVVLYQSYTSDKKIIFEHKIPGKTSVVIGDAEKLQEMVAAFVSNAVKFSKPKAQIIISLNKTARSIKIKFQDEGKGIPQQDLERIFEGFYKTKFSAYKEGMGVGLLLAKHIIGYHRGKLSISSEENQGTVVEVELPRAKI